MSVETRSFETLAMCTATNEAGWGVVVVVDDRKV